MLYNGEKPANTAEPACPALGRLITFEGIDGTGKTTQIIRLVAALRASGVRVLELREPGGTVISEAIRPILLDSKHAEMSQETELLLFAAARAQLVREVIQPALAEGIWVLCDRFIDSTVAYQGYGRGLDLEMIETLNRYAVGSCRPDITFLFDLPVEKAVQRRAGRQGKADRLEAESLAFVRRTRDGYLALAAREPGRIILVDADQPETAIAQYIFSVIREGFGI
jgi:dTMP kinase